MQRIVCRFENGREFLTNLNDTMESPGPALQFQCDFGLPRNQVIRVTVIIRASGECHDLHMRVGKRTSTLDDGEHNLRWCHRLLPTADDAPWLEMLAAKHATACRVTK